MLTKEQRDTFRLALAAWGETTAEDVAELDIDDICPSDENVAETRDTLDDFFNTHGRRLDRHGRRPVVAFEQNRTFLGDVYVWPDVQARKGARRGTLFVMDFGDVRAAYFDGEV